MAQTHPFFFIKYKKIHSNKHSNKQIHTNQNLIRTQMDNKTKETLQKIPLLRHNAGPRSEKAEWEKRLKEEYAALIQYVKINKETDSSWFSIQSNVQGTKWYGKCWYIHNLIKYEFNVQFELPVTYPQTAPDFILPELDGKTAKMYRGGKICQTIHFHPLWSKNAPHFGVAHALALGLAPWLASEIPAMVDKGVITSEQFSGTNKQQLQSEQQ
jgi:ufm1-conjugating enzyme 1